MKHIYVYIYNLREINMHIKRGYRREYRSANWSFNF